MVYKYITSRNKVFEKKPTPLSNNLQTQNIKKLIADQKLL